MSATARALMKLDPTQISDGAKKLEEGLRRLIVGQNEAVDAIIATYQKYLIGMLPSDRPTNFLFLGPTGSGKTRVVEALAQVLLNNPKAVTKIDCAEYQHSHEIAKLIGAPPGYLGHRETHALLSQTNVNMHQTETCKLNIILFDEIEKASDSLWNLLLGILDKGTLTLGTNAKVSFENSIIFMTSNMGAREMEGYLNPAFGFHKDAIIIDPKATSKIGSIGTAAAKKIMTPEFINRLDKIVTFHPLTEEDIEKILEMELYAIQTRVYASGKAPFIMNLDEKARKSLIKKGFDVKYGGRHLKRALETLLINPISNLVATQQIKTGDYVKISTNKDDTLSFSKDERIDPIDLSQGENSPGIPLTPPLKKARKSKDK